MLCSPARPGVVVLLLVLLCFPASAAETAEADAQDQAGSKAWVKERLSNVKAGKRELVRIPFAHHGEWGCNCPGEYIGTQTDSEGGIAWLNPEFEPKVQETRSEKRDEEEGGYMRVAEGYFTGKRTKEKGEEEGQTYTLEGFHVLRWRPLRGDKDARLTVVSAGPEWTEKVQTFTDDRPWLVVVDSLALLDKKTEARATALRDKLVAAGAKDAEVIDSRRAPMLFCCYRVVVSGRYATREAALAAADELKKKKISAGVRRGCRPGCQPVSTWATSRSTFARY